ncbi:MAG: lysozyme inhibitor LprI family protein, partial [Pseudomonadota bacterium]
MMLAAALLTALALTAGTAAAQDLDCAEAPTQAQLSACAADALQEAENRLSRFHDALSTRVSDLGRAQLSAAQDAWLSYRDAQCTFEAAGLDGGSL